MIFRAESLPISALLSSLFWKIMSFPFLWIITWTIPYQEGRESKLSFLNLLMLESLEPCQSIIISVLTDFPNIMKKSLWVQVHRRQRRCIICPEMYWCIDQRNWNSKIIWNLRSGTRFLSFPNADRDRFASHRLIDEQLLISFICSHIILKKSF